jgi:hypothetical protein
MQDTPFFFYSCNMHENTLAAKQKGKIDLARLNFLFSLKAETCLTENRITPRIEATFNV